MIVPAWAARSTCGIWASIGFDRSWTIKVIPCALAQQRLSKAPVCVLQVFSATPGPAQRPAELDEVPVVGALVHEQRLPRRDAVDVDPVRFQLVGERLLDVEDHPVKTGMFHDQAIEDRVDVGRVVHRAVEVDGQPVGPLVDGDLAGLDQAVVVPGRVVAAELDLEALQTVAADPVAEQDGIAVVGLGAGQLRLVERVLAADQVPDGDALGAGE